MCVCVCVCVCLGGEESEIIWNKCGKGKGKEGERRLSASVMNSPSASAQGQAWPLCGLAYARVTHHGIYVQYLQSLYGI